MKLPYTYRYEHVIHLQKYRCFADKAYFLFFFLFLSVVSLYLPALVLQADDHGSTEGNINYKRLAQAALRKAVEVHMQSTTPDGERLA